MSGGGPDGGETSGVAVAFVADQGEVQTAIRSSRAPAGGIRPPVARAGWMGAAGRRRRRSILQRRG
jgi:hypothetical protein